MGLTVLVLHGHGQLPIELVVDVRRERKLALTELQAALARAAFADQRKTRALVVDWIPRVIFVKAVENDGNGRIEGIRRCAGGAGRTDCADRRDCSVLLGGFHLLQLGLRRLGSGQGIGGLLLQGLGIGLESANALGQGGNLRIYWGFGGVDRSGQGQGQCNRNREGAHRDSITGET